MKHYTEDENGVILHFDHGEPSVRAKVLVGADGYFSRVRNQCLNDGPPDFVVSTLPAISILHGCGLSGFQWHCMECV